MADKTWEVVSWPASEGYLKDPETFAVPAFTYAVTRKGASGIFQGSEVGGSLLGALVAWDSYQDFKTFVANETGEHTKLRELFAPTRATAGLEGINKVMATFSSDPLPAFRAPVTGIALARLKPGVDSQPVAESVGKIVGATVDSGRPALGAALGTIIDDDLRSPPDREPYQLVLVTGWNSFEDHKQAVENSARSLFQEVYDQVTIVQHFHRFIPVNA